jgi:hypothetical protein
MSDYLIVADAVAPLSETDAAAGALGLATAFASVGRRVSVLCIATAEQAARQPGLARRLRLVSASVGGRPVEVPLFEGRPTASSAHQFVLATTAPGRGSTTALLGSAAASLVGDGLFSPEVVVGWGETSVAALAALGAASRFLVLPEGTAGAPLPPEEVAELAEADDLGAGQSLLARGLIASDALLVPSPSAARRLTEHPAFAARPSDQPVAVVRLGADDPPHDPGSDPAVPTPYSADAPAGKTECRRALARRLSLAMGAKSLLVVTPPLEAERGGESILSALAQLAGLDVAVVVGPGGDPLLLERAKVLTIQYPGKIALGPGNGGAAQRERLAAADAILLADANDLTSRAAGLAMRYGTLPIAPEAGAFGDYLVDFDPGSATGNALLYAPGNTFEMLGALRRAIALRTDADRWSALVKWLLRNPPRWSTTATLLESLRQSPVMASAQT